MLLEVDNPKDVTRAAAGSNVASVKYIFPVHDS